ncbi:MAG: site-2 protease family protein [Nitrospirae bacterium]|nr:site-2 protease family protein [Nitrospirota bacterium]
MEFENIIRQIAVSALPLLIAITFHEVSHGYVAYRLGDSTAKFMGRLTLNPIAHIDMIGTVIMPLMLLIFTNGQFVFGYAKPVPINPANFKDPKKHMAISAAAGPITNMALAIVSALMIKIILPLIAFILPGNFSHAVVEPLSLMLISSIKWNVLLAVFNLIPVPPLDGGRVLVGFLPHKQAVAYSKIEPYGMMIMILLIMTGIANFFIYPLMMFLFHLISIIL